MTVADYRAALDAFHCVVGVPSWFAPLARLPWADEAGWWEDWYLVEDWAALGRLNAAAVTGERKPPHDVAAAEAADGTAGIYALVAGTPAAPAWSAWLPKPAGLAYADFDVAGAAGAGASVWQRQMTLGPAPEFAVHAPARVALPWPAVETR